MIDKQYYTCNVSALTSQTSTIWSMQKHRCQSLSTCVALGLSKNSTEHTRGREIWRPFDPFGYPTAASFLNCYLALQVVYLPPISQPQSISSIISDRFTQFWQPGNNKTSANGTGFRTLTSSSLLLIISILLSIISLTSLGRGGVDSGTLSTWITTCAL